MITWQGPGTLYHKGRTFKAGDTIPAGILSADRISEFAHKGKLKADEVKEFKPEVEVKPKKKSKAKLEEEELARLIAEEEAEG